MVIPDVSKALSWLEQHKDVIKNIGRGVERETLRVTQIGKLVQDAYPKTIGSPLTHAWVTTDFAEAMFEFVTPVSTSIDDTYSFLVDLHHHTLKHVPNEYFWPISIPCSVAEENEIILAKYGSSNVAQMKEVYRKGLKTRYGATMQIISGVHYNFSFPIAFWQRRYGIKDEISGREQISEGYFNIIRNYFRFGWIIPFLFGASPSVCSKYVKNRQKFDEFECTTKGDCYLPYATSLRIGDLGYTSDAQKNLKVTFNDVPTYVETIKNAEHTRSEQYHQLGIFDENGQRQQLNDNILQIESEFYAYIRPKRVVQDDETMMDALLDRGVQYIEVRALDVNPLSPVGITTEQMRFLDLFLIWCSLVESPEMTFDELHCALSNWKAVINEGRKPGLMLKQGCSDKHISLSEMGKGLFADLKRIADMLDSDNVQQDYRNVLEKWGVCFDDPTRTLSGQIIDELKTKGMGAYSMELAQKYRENLSHEKPRVVTDEMFASEGLRSLAKLHKIEQSDSLSFEDYLANVVNRPL